LHELLRDGLHLLDIGAMHRHHGAICDIDRTRSGRTGLYRLRE
jgi:hypothetical protein